MKFYLYNFATVADFDCHRDDHGYEDLYDLADVHADVATSIDEAKKACLEEVMASMGGPGPAQFTWVPGVEPDAHALMHNGLRIAILRVREYNL